MGTPVEIFAPPKGATKILRMVVGIRERVFESVASSHWPSDLFDRSKIQVPL